MKKIEFTKTVASGNDFIVIEKKNISSLVSRLSSFVKGTCDRKFGIGADGVLLLEKSRIADIRMRIFNADGSEAEMCGNGARCTALYLAHHFISSSAHQKKLTIETKAGIIEGKVSGNIVKIKLTDPKDYQPGVPIQIQERGLKIHSINTGVPHAVIFVEGIKEIEVSAIGRQIRYYEGFAPAGTNVDFVEIVNNNTIKVRTYERGVEDETLACGTGAAASAIVYRLQSQVLLRQAQDIYSKDAEQSRSAGPRSQVTSKKQKVNVITQGAEALKVYFDKDNDTVNNVWLEGKAKIVYGGVYYV